jgi:hypothetical protein
MQWRRLRPGEFDHELIWLSVSVAAALIAWLWLTMRWPTPVCTFHELTGFACPGCGATRCVRYLFRGAWTAAFHVNPMIFITAIIFVIYDLYAAIVLAFRLPRLRLNPMPSWLGVSARFGIPGLIVMNWVWLVINKV